MKVWGTGDNKSKYEVRNWNFGLRKFLPRTLNLELENPNLKKVFYVLVLFFLFTTPYPLYALAPGTQIINTAKATYSEGSATGFVSYSNTITDETVRTSSNIEFLQYAPNNTDAEHTTVAQSLCGPPATYQGVPIGLNPVPLAPTTIYHQADPLFIRVTDHDQNTNPNTKETVIVTVSDNATGDSETITLTETGSDTGVFVGYIQSQGGPSGSSGDCLLTINPDSIVTATYTDEDDNTDVSTSSCLVDPYGIVFDSSSGGAVDGAIITLVNAATSSPATVFGDDGVSSYPSTVISGGSTADSSGAVYDFPQGKYRFPYVEQGNYRLIVEPPSGYNAPSTVATSELQRLPGAPYSIDENGSRGGDFALSAGPPLRIDIPLDPLVSALFIVKTANTDSVSIGDFLRYQISIENTTVLPITDVVVIDTLPLGFRYQKGSAKVNGNTAPDPIISADGRNLTFSLGDMEQGTSKTIHYVVEVASGTWLGKAINNAFATSSEGTTSNIASATVKVTEELFRSKCFITGRVIADNCEGQDKKGADGIEGARIYLEDGTYVITDKDGMFHFEGVNPGVHIVQLDLESIPEKYEAVACEKNTRFAGRAFSQFVDLQGGTLWRTDFHLQLKPKIKGNVNLSLSSALKQGHVNYMASLSGREVDLRNLRLTIMLPEGLTYATSSSTLEGKPLPDPEIQKNTLTYCLGNVPGQWTKEISLRASIKTKYITGDFATKCVLTFDTPDQKNQHTRATENRLTIKSRQESIKHQNKQALSRIGYTIQAGSFVKAENATRLTDFLRKQGLDAVCFTDKTGLYKVHFGNFSSKEQAREQAKSLVDAGVIKDYYIVNSGDYATRYAYASDTEDQKGQPTRVTENRPRRLNITVRPQFAVLSAELRNEDRKVLNEVAEKLKGFQIVHLYVTGYTCNLGIAPQSRHLYADNIILSKARAESVASYLASALGISPSQITVEGKGSGQPVADNDTPEGRALNRRVEIQVTVEQQRYERKINITKGFDSTSEETTGLRPGEAPKILKPQKRDSYSMPKYDKAWLEEARPGIAWLWPGQGYNPPIRSVNLAIKHSPDQRIQLMLNNKEVSPLNFESTNKNEADTIAVSTWRGVDLIEGDNHFQLIVYDDSGNEAARINRMFHCSGPPVHAQMIEAQSILVADGKTVPTMAVRLTDKYGYPVRSGAIGDFTVNPPYIAYEEKVAFEKDPLNKKKSYYTVEGDGIAFVKIEPTSITGEVVLKFPLDYDEKEIRAWIKPTEREWILVGLAEGTVGYNQAKDNMEHLDATDVEDKYYQDGRIAFYAKGKVKGKWLLTMSYDSAKTKEQVGNSLFQTIDPDTYYTLYGDATNQLYDAPSAKKLYMKIEKNQFYAMFGDFNTGFTVAELSRYNRSFTGVKSEMQNKNFEFNVFGAETDQRFVKDEIRGDGTSGIYRLSHWDIVMNSENVFIETRDRFRSENIISSRQLTRHIDYNIDYNAGTIFFKEPIYSKDENFNPIFIVIDYETISLAEEDAYTYGGRGAVKLMDEKVEIGATYIHEDLVDKQNDLKGLDVTINVGKNTEIKGEYATTDTDDEGKGDAYLAKVTHNASKLKGSAYIREQGEVFGLGQQNSSETGTRKLGADAIYDITKTLSVDGEAYRQYNLDTDAERDVGEAFVKYEEDRFSVHTGLRHAEDRMEDGITNTSDQAIVGGSVNLLEKDLTLRVVHEQSLREKNDNPDFPTRTILGADYKITDDVTAFAEEEFTSGEEEDTQSTRLGMKATPWTGGQVGSSLEREYDEYGPRIFANLGLMQRWNITKKWSVDGGLDSSHTVKHADDAPQNENEETASEEETDFIAASLGTTYNQELWTWTIRGEERHTDNEDKWGILTSVYGEVRDGIGLSVGVKILKTDAVTDETNGNVRFGLAYRPLYSRWIVLDRLDFIFNEQEDSVSTTQSWRIVNNLNTNYRHEKTQIALQYGAKYVEDDFDGDTYTGYTDLFGMEARYDITQRWDIGARTSVLHSWNAHQFYYSTGASLGRYVVKNMWVSAGYNFTGFEDRDFPFAGFTAKGPFVRFRMKFDQETPREIAEWLSLR